MHVRCALAAAFYLAACYHAPPVVPSEDVRAAWLEKRGAPIASVPDGEACVASQSELFERIVARAADVTERMAESRATRAAAEIPDARPLGLRLTNVRLSSAPFDRFEAALRFRPERPGTIAAERDAIAREADELVADAEDLARVARFEARVLLARARHAAGLATLAEAEALAAESEVRRIALAKEKQAASDMALAAAEVAAVGAQNEVARRRAEREAVLAELRGRAGLAASCALPNDDATSESPVDGEPEAEALVARALRDHPRIAARWAAERRVDARWEATTRQAWPWIDFVELGLDRQTGAADETTAVMVGLEIALPVFAWGGEATEAARAASLAEAEITRTTVSAIADEVRAAHAALVAAEMRRLSVKDAISEERLATLRAAVRGGYGDPAALAKIERDARDTTRDRIDAQLQVDEARARLDAALGR